MFSYLRPGHKRGASSSTPTSPIPHPHLIESPTHAPDLYFPTQAPRYQLSDNESLYTDSPVSPAPPVLPPIPRIASRYGDDRRQQGQIPDNAQYRRTEQQAQQGRDFEGPKQTSDSPVIFEPVFQHDNKNGGPVQDHSRSSSRYEFRTNSPRQTEYHPSQGFLEPTVSDTGSYRNAPSSSSSSSAPFSVHTVSQAESFYRPPPQQYPQQRSPVPQYNNSHHQKQPKAKLNLLNPMSLLMRRRATHANDSNNTGLSSHKPLTIPAMKLPDDFDPSIRGVGVHDFSAPRQRRNFSGDVGAVSPGFVSPYAQRSPYLREDPQFQHNHRVYEGQTSMGPMPVEERESPKSGEREHTPVFTEDFENDSGRTGMSGVQAEALEGTTTKILQTQLPEPTREAPSLPSFARRLPPNLDPPQKKFSQDLDPVKQLPPISHSGVNEMPRKSIELSTPEKPTEPDSPRSLPSRSSAVRHSGLPKHMASNASRFSFDMGSMGSVDQERLLEEKHMQKMAAKPPSIKDPRMSIAESDLESNYDGMYDMDDGLEERIPGVNADDDFDYQGLSAGLSAFELSSPEANINDEVSPVSPEADSKSTPRVVSGLTTGSATSQDSSISPETTEDIKDVVDQPSNYNGLGLEGIDSFQSSSTLSTGGASYEPQAMTDPRHLYAEEDDMYFDDGIIEPPSEMSNEPFDESMFDDQNLPERGQHFNHVTRTLPRTNNTSSSLSKYTSEGDENDSIAPPGSQVTDTTFSPPSQPASSSTSFQAGLSQHHLNQLFDPAAPELTQKNLAAYHDALAAAANLAAARGKFIRRDSSHATLENYESGEMDLEAREAGLTPNNNDYLEDTEDFVQSGLDDDFDYDDALEDDPIIAEANAEVLANDPDGFYGQEFGFYANANSLSSEAESVYGGFFDPDRIQIGRMNSVREPNLTPITERSEYSNRNSFMSLSMQPNPSQGSQTGRSPGLAQLAGMMSPELEEDEMSLSTLMKLRRGAWGGSNGSLRSSGSAGSQGSGGGNGAKSSTHRSPVSAGGYPNSFPLSSSFTAMPTPSHVGGNVQYGMEKSPDEHSSTSSPISPSVVNFNTNSTVIPWHGSGQFDPEYVRQDKGDLRRGPGRPGHSRKNSATESVSYLKEEDETTGADRWVLERRRTGETGEMEVIGREIVEGGRI